MDSRYLSKPYVAEFLELYRAQTCLWKTDSEEFRSKTRRKVAIKLLIDKFRKVEPGADKEIVMKKLSSFRNSFRRELKKMDEDQNYKPRLWYFKYLLFLKEHETTNQRKSSRKEEVHLFGLIHENIDFKLSLLFQEDGCETTNQTSEIKQAELDNLLDNQQLNENKIALIVQIITSKLRKLPSDKISLVQDMFMSVLLEAESGRLCNSSRISFYEQIGSNYMTINK